MADEPRTAKELAQVVLNHLIQYDATGPLYERDVHYLAVELDSWAERASGPDPAVAKCEWCDWTHSCSAETVVEEAAILRQLLIDHTTAAHPEKFERGVIRVINPQDPRCAQYDGLPVTTFDSSLPHHEGCQCVVVPGPHWTIR